MARRKRRYQAIHFVSLGCPKNRVDTEVMAGIARDKGLAIVAQPEDADILVVNTCAFIESARRESIETLIEMAGHAGPDRPRLLVSAGCLSQRYGDELGAGMPEITHLIGTGQLEALGRIIDGTAPRFSTGAPGHYLQTRSTPRFLEPGAISAYVKIADGCSRRCAFCAIPAIRGRARSRPIAEIVDEAARLADLGVKELNLVAQDSSAFGRDLGRRADLGMLLGRLNRLPGISWIRLLYLYPASLSADLMRRIRDLEKVVPYFDLPIQHASAAMLRKMRRGHGPALLHRRIEQVREIVPGAFLRTAVLVGHPGETDRDFAALVRFIEWAKFDHLGVFRYSAEEGTRSWGMGGEVSRRTSYDRLRRVLAVQRQIAERKNRALRGQVLEVLVERAADPDRLVLEGRHRGQAPEIDGTTYLVSCRAQRGDLLRARVIRTGAHDIVAEPA